MILGTLYIVATPIGNLKDVTLRAIDILNEIDIVLAEDTRVSAKLIGLLKPSGLVNSPQLISYHQHSSDKKKLEILNLLNYGKNIALVTDAGTPGISDPGNELIEYLYLNNRNIRVIPVPGVSSITSALSVSGFKAQSFEFFGYFPKKGSAKVLKYIKESRKTIVFYDSPYRIIKTVNLLIESLGGERKVFLAQEMTKMNERYFRGSLSELNTVLEREKEELGRVKGELVIVI